MATNKTVIKSISLDNLLINLENPRYDIRKNQRAAISTIAHEQGIKLVNLAEDIVDKGLNPSELPIVTSSEGNGTYIVLEGNRRIAAIKLMVSPSLVKSIELPENLAKRYRSIQDKTDIGHLRQIDCAVLSREDASHWILIRHTGENQGVGIVTWDGLQTQRFRGSTPALQAIELVKSSDYINEATRKKTPKIAITNIDRILGTSEARRLLKVDVKSGQLLLKEPEEEAIARLALVISDVANRIINVSDLDTKEQREAYAQDISSRPLPEPERKDSTKSSKEEPSTPTSSTTDDSTTKSVPPYRKTLIPSRFKIVITQTRINWIYHELQKLNIEKFVNCGAVMFRVFLELTADDFAKRHRIPLKMYRTARRKSTLDPKKIKLEKDMTLRQKLNTIADFLESKDICTKPELKGMRALIANKDHILSVDNLNAYVHNKDYSPTATDLKTIWDNLQIFFERTWSV